MEPSRTRVKSDAVSALEKSNYPLRTVDREKTTGTRQYGPTYSLDKPTGTNATDWYAEETGFVHETNFTQKADHNIEPRTATCPNYA